jgi:hypothetical protein
MKKALAMKSCLCQYIHQISWVHFKANVQISFRYPSVSPVPGFFWNLRFRVVFISKFLLFSRVSKSSLSAGDELISRRSDLAGQLTAQEIGFDVIYLRSSISRFVLLPLSLTALFQPWIRKGQPHEEDKSSPCNPFSGVQGPRPVGPGRDQRHPTGITTKALQAGRSTGGQASCTWSWSPKSWPQRKGNRIKAANILGR